MRGIRRSSKKRKSKSSGNNTKKKNHPVQREDFGSPDSIEGVVGGDGNTADLGGVSVAASDVAPSQAPSSLFTATDIDDNDLESGNCMKKCPLSPTKKRGQPRALDYYEDDSVLLWSDDPESKYFDYMLQQEQEHRAMQGKSAEDSLIGDSTVEEIQMQSPQWQQHGGHVLDPNAANAENNQANDSPMSQEADDNNSFPILSNAKHAHTAWTVDGNSLSLATTEKDNKEVPIPEFPLAGHTNHNHPAPMYHDYDEQQKQPVVDNPSHFPSFIYVKDAATTGGESKAANSKRNLLSSTASMTTTESELARQRHRNRALLAVIVILAGVSLTAAGIAIYLSTQQSNGNDSNQFSSNEVAATVPTEGGGGGESDNADDSIPITPLISPSSSPVPNDTNEPSSSSPSPSVLLPLPSTSPTITVTTAPTLINAVPPKLPTETDSPTELPSFNPSEFSLPTMAPSSPSVVPSNTPTIPPTKTETESPTNLPSSSPSEMITSSPTEQPTDSPIIQTELPTDLPSSSPSVTITSAPTEQPTGTPTMIETTELPTDLPSLSPSVTITSAPTEQPTGTPTMIETTELPTDLPSSSPSEMNTSSPTLQPTDTPTMIVTTELPTIAATTRTPSLRPTQAPQTDVPPPESNSIEPTWAPTLAPTWSIKEYTPKPTQAGAPSKAPTKPPTGKVRCGCKNCAPVVNRDADGFTCLQRMEYLQFNMGYSEEDACRQVAGIEFPRDCVDLLCHPDLCVRADDPHTEEAPENDVDDTAILEAQIIPPTVAPAPATPRPTSLDLDMVANDGEPTTSFPLGRCEGDCDSDDDCGPGLVCYQRVSNEAVPGCVGGEQESSNTDFCVPLNIIIPPELQRAGDDDVFPKLPSSAPTMDENPMGQLSNGFLCNLIGLLCRP